MSLILSKLLHITTPSTYHHIPVSEIEMLFLSEMVGSHIIYQIIVTLLQCDRPISLSILSKICNNTTDSIQNHISAMELKGLICQDFSWKTPHVSINATRLQKNRLQALIIYYNINQIIELAHVFTRLVN
jgi:hypothetical protein